jgi:hypothetical protein
MKKLMTVMLGLSFLGATAMIAQVPAPTEKASTVKKTSTKKKAGTTEKKTSTVEKKTSTKKAAKKAATEEKK